MISSRRQRPPRHRVLALLIAVGVAVGLGGCVSPSEGAGVSAGAVIPTALPPLASSPTPRPTLRPTFTPATPRPSATHTPAPMPTAEPSPATVGDPFTIGGIRLANGDAPLTLTYPSSWDGDRHTVADIDLLVSDPEGESLALFDAIGTWLGEHKIFVYPDTTSGRPVLSIHDGTYSGVPLEAEPLRLLIEGSFHNPYPADKIEERLIRLRGERFTLEQDGNVAEFEVVDGVRMDAATTVAFRDRPGDISTLVEPLERPEDTFLVLICSTRQADEPQEIFPARIVLALSLVR